MGIYYFDLAETGLFSFFKELSFFKKISLQCILNTWVNYAISTLLKEMLQMLF